MGRTLDVEAPENIGIRFDKILKKKRLLSYTPERTPHGSQEVV